MKYRHRIELIADVLFASLKGTMKTHIMNQGNLNFKQLNFYLKIVMNSGLLLFDSTNKLYFITEKGETFLSVFKGYKQRLQELEEQHTIVDEKRLCLERMCSL